MTERRDIDNPGRRATDHCDAHQRNTETLDHNTELLNRIVGIGSFASVLVVILCGIIGWYVSLVRSDSSEIKQELKEIRQEMKVNNELLIAGREKRLALEQRVGQLEDQFKESHGYRR